MNNKYLKIAEEILDLAGININGSNPWDIQVHNPNFYRRLITQRELGLGESYMEGWWDVERLDEMIYRIFRAKIDEKVKRRFALLLKLSWARFINLQSKRRAFIIGERHYDLGNELFENMLDKRLNYSCAYWKDAKNLDEAQEHKLELICRKLDLKPDMKVLDIGCGWGAFGKYAAEKYKVEVTGVTVSKEQVELGQKLCKGLPVQFLLKDYRELSGAFDRIVSVGMIEHVGYKNYRTFFETANRCLKDDGLFLLHTIGNNESQHAVNRWTHKYIFPNGMLPSIAQLGKATETLFVMEDWHSFGADYDKTLMSWHHNFDKNWGKIKDKYPGQFYRMWRFYLLSSAGSFRASNIQLWQIVLSKNGVLKGYSRIN